MEVTKEFLVKATHMQFMISCLVSASWAILPITLAIISTYYLGSRLKSLPLSLVHMSSAAELKVIAAHPSNASLTSS